MRLNGDVVVTAGAAVATRDGLDEVGVRSVAHDLGVTPMALYRHVGDAAALRAAVVERLLADLPTVPAAGPWDERCRAWAHAARAVLARTPGLAHHVLLSWMDLPRVLVVLDGLVAMLASDGPPGIDPPAAANAVLTHVLMRAQAEEAVRAGGTARELATLHALRSQVPTLWEHRDEYRFARLDEHFAYGLAALLLGLDRAERAT